MLKLYIKPHTAVYPLTSQNTGLLLNKKEH